MLSTNNRSSSNSTPRNENATQKLIRANVDFLIEQLEAGRSDALTAYLTAMSHFRRHGRPGERIVLAERKLRVWRPRLRGVRGRGRHSRLRAPA